VIRAALSLALALALALAACSFDVPEGRFRCATEQDCPQGWSCNAQGLLADGLCYSSRAAIPTCFPGVPDLDRGQLDLLLVIDDTTLSADQLEQFATALPELSRSLVTGQLQDGLTFPPLDIRVGVVTSNLGASGLQETVNKPIVGCSGLGDDGRLRTQGNTTVEGCPSTYSVMFQSLSIPPKSTAADVNRMVDQFSSDVACLTTLPAGECQWEQPLEAALKALTPADSPIKFAGGTDGRGSEHSFVRAKSVLAVVVVTDEDDWSVSDPALFSASGERYPGSIFLRHFKYPEALHPLERYIEGFRALRPERPDLFVFAAFAGIPDDLASSPDSPPYDEILDHPAMELKPGADLRWLAPVCESADKSWSALPARRLVEVARAFGGVLQSACHDPFYGMRALARQIADRVKGACK
jgi:hypothetical protein